MSENERRKTKYAQDPEYAEKRRRCARAWAERNRARKNAVERQRRLTGKKNEQNRAWHRRNREKVSAYARAYRVQNAERLRDYFYQRRYGISLKEYAIRLAEQNGVCAICKGKNPPGRRARRLGVDHDHKTGEARGLLCDACNQVLGLMNDDATTLRRAADYLDERRRRCDAGR